MAKDKIDGLDDIMQSMFGASKKPVKSWTKNDFKKLFAIDSNPEHLTHTERMIMIASAVFIQNGITPDLYADLYKYASENLAVNLMPLNMIFPDEGENDSDEGTCSPHLAHHGLTSFPLPDAKKKSLVLKIQLRGIQKPPLWREVVIPASYNFEQLHEVIQILFGWTNSHMWQFEKTPYSHGYVIGPAIPDMGLDDGPTDIASDTPVTKVLKKAKDKMVYVYDFGDDWVHDITVKEVLDNTVEHPECLKWKSDNPMEDIGGIWGLQEFREMSDPAAKFTKKRIKEFLDNTWFDSMAEFTLFMDNHKFNLAAVNKSLESL